MRKLSLPVRSTLGALLLVGAAAAPAANAATIVDQGTNFMDISYCDGNPAGNVVLHLTTLAPGSIDNEISQVLPAAGWSYAVKKSGGINQPIEIDFTNPTLRATPYKSLVQPGKTSVSCPVLK